MRALVCSLILLIPLSLYAQRPPTPRPDTDVGPADNTFVLASIKQDQAILYTVYVPQAGNTIRGYVAWNNTAVTVRGAVHFVSGSPWVFSVGPQSRAVFSVAERGFSMSLNEEGALHDANARGNLGHTGRVDQNRVFPNRFPLPTKR